MFKTVAKDIIENPALWVRKESWLVREFSYTNKNLSQISIEIFGKFPYDIIVGGHKYKLTFINSWMFKKAKDKWVKFIFSNMEEIFDKHAMPIEKWMKARENKEI